MSEFKGKINHGALTNAPIYETHKRGKNWMAIIRIDPTSPGGLSRKFITRANGEYKYLTNELKENDAIEFGADYYSGRGSKSINRWYGVIRKITNNEITIEQFETGNTACQESEKFHLDVL